MNTKRYFFTRVKKRLLKYLKYIIYYCINQVKVKWGLFMYDAEIFAERLKLLRRVYKLNLQQLSSLASLALPVSQATINHWENKRRVPALSAIQGIADVFSVSLDWLSGRSDIPYTESLMCSLEREYCPLKVNAPDESIITLWPAKTAMAPDEYINERVRHIYYSLGVRANILLLLQQIKLDVLKNDLIIKNPANHKYSVLYTDINQEYMMSLYRLVSVNNRLGLPEKQAALVPFSKPIFDLEKEIKQSINHKMDDE